MHARLVSYSPLLSQACLLWSELLLGAGGLLGGERWAIIFPYVIRKTAGGAGRGGERPDGDGAGAAAGPGAREGDGGGVPDQRGGGGGLRDELCGRPGVPRLQGGGELQRGVLEDVPEERAELLADQGRVGQDGAAAGRGRAPRGPPGPVFQAVQDEEPQEEPAAGHRNREELHLPLRPLLQGLRLRRLPKPPHQAQAQRRQQDRPRETGRGDLQGRTARRAPPRHAPQPPSRLPRRVQEDLRRQAGRPRPRKEPHLIPLLIIASVAPHLHTPQSPFIPVHTSLYIHHSCHAYPIHAHTYTIHFHTYSSPFPLPQCPQCPPQKWLVKMV